MQAVADPRTPAPRVQASAVASAAMQSMVSARVSNRLAGKRVCVASQPTV
jgi:hypothetical protein